MNNTIANANAILSLSPPPDFVPRIEVVASFIQHQDKLLLLKRHPLKPEGNTWCVPGGKRDAHETLIEAIQRETHEETGLNFIKEDFQHCYVTYARYPYMDFLYHLFRMDLQSTNINLNIQLNPAEHQDFRWLTISEAYQFPLTPGINEALALLF